MTGHKTLCTAICPWLNDSFEFLDRAYREGQLGHAWLLSGPVGVGKLNLALAFTNRLLDPRAQPPGELSAASTAVALPLLYEPGDHHPDLHWVFPDPEKTTRSISVDQIRDTSQKLTMTSLHGQKKAVIIDPADALTAAASNALLKTLEEPTRDTYLFLVSQQPGHLPATIRSRCQTLNVVRPPNNIALDWLEESPERTSRNDWTLLLALANRSPLRALTLNEQEYISKNNKFEDKLNLISRNKLDPHLLADEWLKEGIELPLIWLATRLQRVIRTRMTAEVSNPITDLGSDRLHNTWQALTLDGLFQRLDAAERLLSQIGGGTNAELALRVLLMTFLPQRGQT
jgi:DNA polymerase-3 subunit delta'